MDLFKRVRTAWEKELDQAARKKKKWIAAYCRQPM
jgi:hypothetical protein